MILSIYFTVGDEYYNDENYDRLPTDKESFDALMFWLSENDCTSEEKKRMKGSFDFDSFTVEDLLTDVKKSGLFSVEEIDRRVLEICREKDEEIEELRKKESLYISNFVTM